MATEAGISIDAEGFKRLMLEQKNRAKADAKETINRFKSSFYKLLGNSSFKISERTFNTF
jgi:alanyl-tRNA synthetase